MRRGLIIFAIAVVVVTLIAMAFQIDDFKELLSLEDPFEEAPPSVDAIPNPECSHVDADADHMCDDCGAPLSECGDSDKNHKCDVCDQVLSDCADTNGDHRCDLCGKVLTECADTNKDHKCDLCLRELTKCADLDNDHTCDTCGKALAECADTNKDHKCDTCGNTLSECADANKDHKCDTCSDTLSECTDADKNHACDVCGAASECADSNADHCCDICKEQLTQCVDDDTDHLCDVCGIRVSGACADSNLDGCCDVCDFLLDTFLAESFSKNNGTVTLSLYGVVNLVDPLSTRQWKLYASTGELIASGDTNGANEIDLSSHMEVGFNYLIVVSYDYGNVALEYYRSDLTLFSGPAPEGIEIPEGAVVLFENECITDTFTYLEDPEFNVQYYAILDNTVLLTGVFVWENGGDESDTESFYYRFYDKDNRLCLEYERFGEWGWRLVGDYGSEAYVTVYSIP